MEELKQLKELLVPQEVLLVCDSATGQQAVSVAEHFHNALGLTGNHPHEARRRRPGGAALSLREVTKQPIKFAGVGEKIDQFEPFHPERLAGRILGMGDVVSLVEKAAEAITEEDARRIEEKMRHSLLRLQRFPPAVQAAQRMGPLENVLGMLPGMDKLKDSSVDEKQLKRVRRSSSP